MSENMPNFMVGLMDGLYLADEIDDFIDTWHDMTDGSIELHEFLGMSWAEYSLWANNPDSIFDIASARRRNISLEEAVNDNIQSSMKLAARSNKASEIAYLQNWINAQLKGNSRY
ncbi:hypothetical protein [Parasphingorhabdus sp.]|uniref:hypothetical protein n=1 Tax=Parasphingorhabdus sp. TaxID=2709688 RepID=UPI003593B5D4